MQRFENLRGKKGITLGLLYHQIGEGPGRGEGHPEGVGNELVEIVEGEGRKGEGMDGGLDLGQLLQGDHEWMAWKHLVGSKQ